MSNPCPQCGEESEAPSLADTEDYSALCNHCERNDVQVYLYRRDEFEYRSWERRPDGGLPEEWSRDGKTYSFHSSDATTAIYKRDEPARFVSGG